MKNCFLGLDTSNYTTSAALCDAEGTVFWQKKLPLPVQAGACGLRQSDAVFAHVKNLPEILTAAGEELAGKSISAVGVSCRPRSVEGSYMPCFLTGVASATAVSAGAGAPLFRFSHQDGHVAAALYSAGMPLPQNGRFAAFHVSGGTTEILLGRYGDALSGFGLEKVGGTLDIHCGQAIDRVGVMLGLDFPCGPALEKYASAYKGAKMPVSVCVKGLNCNLSGLQNQAEKRFAEMGDRTATAFYVFAFVAKTLEKMTAHLREIYPDIPIVYAGGVMSSSLLQQSLRKRFRDVWFAEPAFSADNAAGIAVLTRRAFLTAQRREEIAGGTQNPDRDGAE